MNDFNLKLRKPIILARYPVYLKLLSKQGTQDVKSYEFIILQDYIFIASKSVFDSIRIEDKIFSAVSKSFLSSGTHNTKLGDGEPKTLDLYCRQINALHNELDDQPSKLMISISITEGSLTYSFVSRHLIYLPLENCITDHLEFVLRDEENRDITPM